MLLALCGSPNVCSDDKKHLKFSKFLFSLKMVFTSKNSLTQIIMQKSLKILRVWFVRTFFTEISASVQLKILFFEFLDSSSFFTAISWYPTESSERTSILPPIANLTQMTILNSFCNLTNARSSYEI